MKPAIHYINRFIHDLVISEGDFTELKTWLAHYSHPWTQVLAHWEQTGPNRLKQFEDDTLTIGDILKDWPSLKHPLGYTLVSNRYLRYNIIICTYTFFPFL